MSSNYFRGLLSSYENSNTVVYCIPFDGNASVASGASQAPKKLIELSAWLPPYTMDGKSLSKIKVFVCDYYDIDNFDDILKVSNVFNDNKFKIIFGGDHSISIPFQKKFIDYCHDHNKEPVIVHIDAHCDICSIYFGNYNSHACTVKRALENGLNPNNLFMVGIREFEQDGYENLLHKPNGINLFTSLNIHEDGLEKFVNSIKKYNNDKYLIYVSFDIDSLDSAFAPGTGTPETCGLTPFQLRKILITLAEMNNVMCLDIVEIAPPLDNNDVTSWTALKLLYEFLGHLNIGDKK